MKGIILVGGRGSRLYPLTMATHKQLLPIYDKPMIYYSLATLMEAGIRDILIISTKEYVSQYAKLLGDGSDLGMNLSYTTEPAPRGTAQALMLAEEFVGDDTACLIFGDNIFLGNMKQELKYAVHNASEGRATVFGYPVYDPQRFGVVEFDQNGQVLSLEEKPQNPKSNYAVVGLYFYPNIAVKYANSLTPSARGEYEITDVNNMFLNNKTLDVVTLSEDIHWLDAGTNDSLIDASVLVRKLEKSTGQKLGCIDEVAYKNKWISKDQLLARASKLHPSDYSKDLIRIAKGIGVNTNKR